MKKIIIVFSILLINFSIVFGQEKAPNYFKNGLNNYGIAVASNESSSAVSINWNHQHFVNKNKKFSIGYGIRFNSNFGKGDFRTAPSKLTSGVESPLVIFADDKPENFDTISVNNFAVNSLNASIHLNYAFTKKWEVEFNIDAVGFSFGNNVIADYNSSKRLTTNPVLNTKQEAKPTSLNALLISDNDIGSLNSEIKIKYFFKPNWALNFGGTFIFAEYTTTNKLFKENDRFRQKSFMPMIGISYSPFRK
ncbi:MAG: hypothetical protein ACOYMA_05400 [Bacteroidia bacterium]